MFISAIVQVNLKKLNTSNLLRYEDTPAVYDLLRQFVFNHAETLCLVTTAPPLPTKATVTACYTVVSCHRFIRCAVGLMCMLRFNIFD